MKALHIFYVLKVRWYISTLLSFVLVSLLLTGCGDDDEGPSTRDLLIGIWELREINSASLSGTGYALSITLEANGDYEERITEDGSTYSYDGEWVLDGNNVAIEYDDGDEVEINLIEVTAKELEVEVEGDEYLFEKD